MTRIYRITDTPRSPGDLTRTLATAPWCSDELLDAVEEAIDAGRIDEVDRIFEARECGELLV